MADIQLERTSVLLLPVYLTRFFGREAELGLLDILLADPSERVITLVGPAGVGKTRLLVETIERSRQIGWGTVLFIDGAALERPALLLPEIVNRLGIEPAGDQASGEVLSEKLAGERLLLLLDNMEHLLSAAIDVAALARALPGLRIVATSRSPLHISGERIVDVEPLHTCGRGEAGLPSAAARLFSDRAARTGKLGELTSADITLIEQICVELDGLPLAIELAAARLRVLSLSALQAVLTNRLTVLVDGPVDVSERHRTLRAAIGWSYELLQPAEQRLLCELGVFTESFSFEAITAVSTLPSDQLVSALASLVDQALLMRSEDALEGKARFRMLIAIRDFAIEKLKQSGDEEQIRDRHAAWFLDVAERLEPQLAGPNQQQALAQLVRIEPNLRQTLDFLISRQDQERALRLVAALSRYWHMRLQWDEAQTAYTEVFALAPPRATQSWGAALRGAAIIAETQYDGETALMLNQQAIAIWEELGDTSGIARSRIDLGNVYNNLGRFEEALTEFRQAAKLVDRGADPRTYLVAMGSIANTALRQGALRESVAVLEEVIPAMRELGDGWILATCLSNFGIAKQRLGDLASARALFQESLAIRESLGDEYGAGATLVNLGSAQEDPILGVQFSRRALELALRLGAPDIWAAAQIDLAIYALDQEDRSTAAQLYIEALNGYASINEEVGQADVIGIIAELVEERDPALAARFLGFVSCLQRAHDVDPVGAVADRVRSIEKRVRQRLGSPAFETAFDQGCRFTLAEARVEALQAARVGGSQPPSPQENGKRLRAPANSLTPRELDVLRLITAGKTDRQIAEELFISPKTANHHVTRILAKLECRNRAAATALALQQGLISPTT